MQILSVHNSYKIRGGEDASCEAEVRLLKKMGHQVSRYEESNHQIDKLNPLDVAARTVWSTKAYQVLMHQLTEQAHDIVHVQNFFPLISPSIYYAAQKKKVPVVQTLRNYRLLCPNALFFRDGQVCEDCMGKSIPWPGVINSCYKESFSASGVVATMLTVHRAMRTWTEMVDVYVALTHFACKKFIEGGIPQDKIVVKPNFVDPDPGQEVEKEDFAIFVGRLSVEKGIDTLIQAWQQLGKRISLKIVGEGPLEDQVIQASQHSSSSIEWLGRKPLNEVYDLIGKAKVLIFPSKWYETFGRVAVEAFAKGTPVIASKLGAIAEIVDHGRTGFHFHPGDSADLARQVDWALNHPEQLTAMGHEARAEFEAKYTAQANYHKLIEIYDLARSQ
ncbi:glycosyltransferase family 4 protein [Leptolyngbya sp. AN02str]|uniref:glycosyltransferase family 4 protein n=1 Tax=Leptolyngbya sp. AN02str TaxID=3423363 RepID=UPI003D31934E